MILARIVLWISAAAFAVIGVPALFAPALIADAAGYVFSTSFTDSDFRAVYGGLSCACAALLGGAAVAPGRLRDGLVLQQWMFGGLVLGRLVSLAAIGWPAAPGPTLFAAEALGLLAGFVAHRRLAR